VERWAAAHPDRGPAWRRPSIRPIVAFWTGQVREIMDLAVAQAQALDHGWLGDEHLLLALLDGDCPGAAPAALDSCGLTLGAVRAATAEVVGEPCPTAYHGILVSHRTQYVGERANLKAVELRDEEVASEHVLLACSRPRPKAARGRCYRAPESTSTRSAEL
jgi:ATP-dependent Clp protease ATP-binding subunit ClpA